MLIAILYLIAKNWRKGKCPLVVERTSIAVRRKTLLLQSPVYKGREQVSGTSSTQELFEIMEQFFILNTVVVT